MAFSALTQFVPGDEPGQNRWLLEHYLEHQMFYTTLLEQSPAIVTVNYPIQRIETWPDWLAAHNQQHQSLWTGIGGGEATDLGTLKWEDKNALLDWFQTHADVHTQIRDSLGL